MTDAAEQAWQPFVLVAGLVLIGHLAARDGLFAALAARLDRPSLGPRGLLLMSLLVVAIASALLNLDSAAVFLTPVLILLARRRGLDEAPFLYGAIFMTNAASLFLPGSNLTNLLVLAQSPVSGGRYFVALLPGAIAAAAVTAAGILLLERRRLAHGSGTAARPAGPAFDHDKLTGIIGPLAALGAAILVVSLQHPAVPVLALAIVAAAAERVRSRISAGEVWRAVDPKVLVALFALAVAVGTLARHWPAPADLLGSAGAWTTAAVAAGTSIAINNLPAAMLLTAEPVAHPRALLYGLGIGPNLAVTGSLSAYLWWRAARSVGTRPSVAQFSRRGIVLAPAAIAAALLATELLGSSRL